MSDMMTSTAAAHDERSATARVTAEEVRRVAELANLELTDDELPAIEHDLNAILGYIEQLNELDTTGVPPMAQVGELLAGRIEGENSLNGSGAIYSQTIDAEGRALRADRIRPSLDRSQVLSAAPESDGAFFKVPKVIER